MLYKTFAPGAPLDGFIENIRYWQGGGPGHAKDTIMASGRLGLLINLSRDELSWYGGALFRERNVLSGIGLCGAHARTFAIDAFQPHMMGVQFKPGGAFAFLGGSAREFEDAHVSLGDVWGRDAERLHQRLVRAPTPDDKSPSCSATWPRASTSGRAIPRSRSRCGCSRARRIAVERHGYYDQPHFIREFKEFSGFTPGEYLRLRGPYLQHVPLHD